jgi:hypothetical protein
MDSIATYRFQTKQKAKFLILAIIFFIPTLLTQFSEIDLSVVTVEGKVVSYISLLFFGYFIFKASENSKCPKCKEFPGNDWAVGKCLKCGEKLIKVT